VHRAQQVAYVRREAIMLAVDRLSTDYAGTHPGLREVKETVPIIADLGHFVVSGSLHLTQDGDLGNWLLDSRLFVPLTDVTIKGSGTPPVSGPVAIINRATLGAILR
jgi:hypothetical protein